MVNLFMKGIYQQDAYIFGIVPYNEIKEFSIRRVNSGFHYFRPIFQLWDSNEKMIAKAKKNSIFTFQILKIDETSHPVIGKIESNFKGNLLNI